MARYVAIADYGMGNLRSIGKAVAYLGGTPYLTRDGKRLRDAAGIVLPGVGAFPAAARRLRETGLGEVIVGLARGGKPLLGICLGMQLLYEGSEEGEGAAGLGLLPGTVRRLPPGPKIPHMGWNSIRWQAPMDLFRGLEPPLHFYFVHSFAAPIPTPTPEPVGDHQEAMRVAICEYGIPFVAAVERGPVAGTQFHPEKSGRAGLEVLRSFLRRCGVSG